MQPPNVHAHEIRIVVEVDEHARPIQFDHTPVTGREIREKAGVPLDDDLVRLVHGKPSGGPIGLDDKVEIKNGDKFLAVPRGKVS